MDRVVRFAPLSGLVFAVLFGGGSALWAFEQPSQDAQTGEIVAFYSETATEIQVGGTISIISLIFLVWFGAVLRERLITVEAAQPTGLPSVAFAGFVLAAAVGLGAETINMAGAFSADGGQLTGDTAQIYFDVSWAFGAPAAGVAFAMSAAGTAVVALRAGLLLPAWAAWLAVVLALTLLTPVMWTSAFQYPATAAVLLAAALSVRLYRDESLSNNDRFAQQPPA